MDVLLSAVSGLMGALIGGAASYLGAVRAAGRANRASITGSTPELIRLLLESDDPELRARARTLLEGALASLADLSDAPDDIRRAAGHELADGATSTADLERALAEASAARGEGADVDFEASRPGEGDDHHGRES